MVVPLPSWLQALWFLSLLSISVGSSNARQEMRMVDFQQACNQANVEVVQGYLKIPGFVDQLKDEDCALLMATAIHSTIYGLPRGHEVMNLLACEDRCLHLGSLGTTVVEKAMASGNFGMAIHILSNFEVEEASAGQGLVAAAKSHQWKAIEAIFQFHDTESVQPEELRGQEYFSGQEQEEEERVWVIQFEAGALRDFLILTSEQGEFGLFWKAIEVARETGSVDLEQFLFVIDQGMAASQTFDQLAAFVNLLMNDPYEYIEHLQERRDLSFPFAGQILHIFQARNIIMEETGVPEDIGNLILDKELNDAMFRFLERPRDVDMPTIYPSSLSLSDVDQVNETIDEADDDGTVDLPPPVMAAPVSGNSALSAASPRPQLSQVRPAPLSGEDLDLPDTEAATSSPLVTGAHVQGLYKHRS